MKTPAPTAPGGVEYTVRTYADFLRTKSVMPINGDLYRFAGYLALKGRKVTIKMAGT